MEIDVLSVMHRLCPLCAASGKGYRLPAPLYWLGVRDDIGQLRCRVQGHPNISLLGDLECAEGWQKSNRIMLQLDMRRLAL